MAKSTFASKTFASWAFRSGTLVGAGVTTQQQGTGTTPWEEEEGQYFRRWRRRDAIRIKGGAINIGIALGGKATVSLGAPEPEAARPGIACRCRAGLTVSLAFAPEPAKVRIPHRFIAGELRIDQGEVERRRRTVNVRKRMQQAHLTGQLQDRLNAAEASGAWERVVDWLVEMRLGEPRPAPRAS